MNKLKQIWQDIPVILQMLAMWGAVAIVGYLLVKAWNSIFKEEVK